MGKEKVVMKKVTNLIIIASFMISYSCSLWKKELNKQLHQETVIGEITNNRFLIKKYFDSGSRELKASVKNDCKKHTNIRLSIKDKEHSDIPIKNAAIYRIDKYGEDEFLISLLGEVDNNGEICIPQKTLQENGILIEMVGYLKLTVKLKS